MENLQRLAELWRFHLDDTNTLGSNEEAFFPHLVELARGAHRILEIGAEGW